MTVYYVLGIMGSGKTLFTTLKALEFSEKYPNHPIYANYHLKLPNFIYTPLMFLPYNSLDTSLIICDDFYALSNSDGLIGVMVNLSRKANIDIYITCQYYTQVKPKIREVCLYKILCQYDKINDILYIGYYRNENIIKMEYVNEAVKKVKKIYDTNERVLIATERKIISEIINQSNTLDDLELNFEIYASSSAKMNKLYNTYSKHPKFNGQKLTYSSLDF